MEPIQITNCHVHTFTQAHVPRDFPYKWTRLFQRVPILIKGIAWIVRLLGQEDIAEKLDRLYRFQQEAQHDEQATVLANVKKHYPSNTCYVVLPMDMTGIGYGPVAEDLRTQHDKLHQMAQAAEPKGSVIPFATVNPLSKDSAQEGLRAIKDLQFKGLKIYPRMGFAPDHPVLMETVYPEINKRKMPVMTHCSRRGVQGREVSDYIADRFTEPKAYRPVMRAFPDMRICLAHFGGQKDWHAYANGEAPRGNENWQVQIRDMIGSGQWPQLWTDISYTLFHFDDYIPFLRLFLLDETEAGDRLRSRVLFGSDFYMTRQEKLSEKAVCFRLRNALGEEVFRQIAQDNPKVWLRGDGNAGANSAVG